MSVLELVGPPLKDASEYTFLGVLLGGEEAEEVQDIWCSSDEPELAGYKVGENFASADVSAWLDQF